MNIHRSLDLVIISCAISTKRIDFVMHSNSCMIHLHLNRLETGFIISEIAEKLQM